METQTVRFIDNFSAGTRGATSAEYFLEQGYAVIFMHRQFSLQPYSRHYSHARNCFLEFMEADDQGIHGKKGAHDSNGDSDSDSRFYVRHGKTDRSELPYHEEIRLDCAIGAQVKSRKQTPKCSLGIRKRLTRCTSFVLDDSHARLCRKDEDDPGEIQSCKQTEDLEIDVKNQGA